MEEDQRLEFEEFCRKTYTIDFGTVTIRCLFEKHATQATCWNQDMVLRIYSFVADAIRKYGHESRSHGLTIFAGAEAKGGCMVEIDIQGVGIPLQFLRKLHDDICHYLINIRK